MLKKIASAPIGAIVICRAWSLNLTYAILSTGKTNFSRIPSR